MAVNTTHIALLQSSKLPSNFSQIGSYLGGRELQHLYDDCTSKISLCGNEIGWINARLYQIDPQLIGEKRSTSALKCYFTRIKSSKELKFLRDRKITKQNLINQITDKRYKVESQIHHFVSTNPPRLGTWRHRAVRAISQCKSFVKSAFSALSREKGKIEAASHHLFDQNSPETSRKLIQEFFGGMPIVKGDDKLRANLETRFRLPEQVQVSSIDPDTIQIDCITKLRGEIDLDSEITKEECERLDPGNPLSGSDEPIVVNDLRRFGSIDPPWWDWLKVKSYPAFGPRVIIRRENNTLHFLKGSSLLSRIELLPNGIAFKALFLREKVLDWTADDFFLFLSKFKSV